MKRIPFLILSLSLAVTFSACGSAAGQGDANSTPAPEVTVPADNAVETSPVGQSENEPSAEPAADGKVLVAYFSATNNTEGIAQHIQSITGGDIFKIVPEIPYTSDDLNYNTDCRANREQNDDSARPAISATMENIEDYDVIFLGYPIWWGQAPKIMYTFLESYDMSGKTIVPFCTSGSSDIGSSAANLHPLASAAAWMEGRRFSGSASSADVQSWVESLDLNFVNESEEIQP